MKFSVVAVLFVSTATLALGIDENSKNHAPEKRQDRSYLFGGWTPIKPGHPFYHGGTTDLLSLGDGGLDTASTFYSSLHQKDIYSYYPRPAIKAKPKHNTPVYTESVIKRGRRPQKYNRGPQNDPHVAVAAFKDFPIEHLKGLHETFLAAHPLPLPQLQLNNQRDKNVELLEIAVHPIHEEVVSEVKGVGYDAFPQGRHQGQPLNLGYPPVSGNSRGKPNQQRRPPNISPVAPFPLAHIPASDIVDLKNFEVIEYPVSAFPLHHVSNGNAGTNGHYGRQHQHSRLILPQGHAASSRFPSKVEHGHQATFFQGALQQPRQPVREYPSNKGHQNQGKFEYGGQEQEVKLDYQQHPQLSAELIKVSDDQIKALLKSIQVVDKSSKDVFTYVPLPDTQQKKGDDLHLLVALPHQEIQLGGSASQKHNFNGYESNFDRGGRGNDIQAYGSPEVAHKEKHSQGPRPSKQSQGQHQVSYQPGSHHGQGQAVEHHQEQNQYGKAPVAEYNPTTYEQEQSHSEGPAIVHTGKYIELKGSHTGEDGYRREPVLALELKEGESIEDAIKALDPETLQKLGAYSKDGLEIEIVEVPDEEYGSESQKHETVVPGTKSTGGKKKLRATVRSAKKKN